MSASSPFAVSMTTGTPAVRGSRLSAAAHVEAADARQHQVEQNQVRRIRRSRTKPVLPRGRAHHREPFLLEVEPDQFPDVLFVLDREYARSRHG